MAETATRWTPPDPRQLPEIRAELLDHYATTPALMSIRAALDAGRNTIMPTVPGMDASPAAVGAQLLVAAERRRIADASLYYATEDMTALALAAAQTPPVEKVSLSRPPAESGLLVFAEPIGGYTDDVGQTLSTTDAARDGVDVQVTTPIVAVSWSTWTPHDVQLDHGTVRWTFNRLGAASRTIPSYFRGIWLTFHSPRGLFSGLPADTVIGSMADGTVMTAGMMDSPDNAVRGPALNWDNESILAEGAPFEPAAPDSTGAWANVVYTAWQLMAASGTTRWTETEEIPRPRAGAKRDARQGITGPGTVKVVRVHTARRPSPQAAAQDAAASTGRREPQWSCRWPVRPHRRDHCMNPGKHAAGECAHEDRLIPGYVKGPQDKPLRTGSTVHLWDRQPEMEE
ncbi:hypothetical protein [Streptomyces sp. DW26H14]|uniref:hypothetical protein n=1 Tax=Streptomyces sp. DW26H14 TaxID=3435395 RepID=UPI00403D8CDF